MFPFAAEEGEDAGDLFVGELRERGHGEVPGAGADFHRAGHAVDADIDREKAKMQNVPLQNIFDALQSRNKPPTLTRNPSRRKSPAC